jgi:tetratricopeptide (TPR) repeat protein
MMWVLVAALFAGASDAPASPVLTAQASPAPSPLADALALEAAGNDAGALAALERLILNQPRWELPRLEAARLLLKGGSDPELARAGAHLDAAEREAPDNPRVYFLRGLLLEERGAPLEAIRAQEKAVALRPSYDDARFRLAGLWLQQGDWLKAEYHYRPLSKSRPAWVQVRMQLASVLEKQGRTLDAERELLAAREAQPDNPGVLRTLAAFYERTDRPQLAAKVRSQLTAPPKRVLRPLKPSKR